MGAELGPRQAGGLCEVPGGKAVDVHDEKVGRDLIDRTLEIGDLELATTDEEIDHPLDRTGLCLRAPVLALDRFDARIDRPRVQPEGVEALDILRAHTHMDLVAAPDEFEEHADWRVERALLGWGGGWEAAPHGAPFR